MTTTTLTTASGGFTVSSGDTLIVSAGGVASNVQVAYGGSLIVAGGSVISTSLSGTETIDAGSATGDTVVNGATLTVSGGVALDTTVIAGGIENNFGGQAIGTVIDSGGAAGASGTGAVMVSATVSNGGTLNILAGATASGTQILDGGSQYVFAGGVDVSPSITGNSPNTGGNDWISSGGTVVNPNDGQDGTLSLLPGSVVSGAIIFTPGVNNDLDIYSQTVAGVPQVTISGYASTMTIDLIGLPYPGPTPLSFNSATDQLMVPTLSGTVTLQLSGNYTGAVFSGTDDGYNYGGGGDGDQVIVMPCFAAGTRIMTPQGPVRVEDLAVGDLVEVRAAGATPVVWIGSRHIDCRRHPAPSSVLPVRVQAGAFGDNRPSRDLYLSPDHAVFEAGALIPIRCLINDTTIAQVPAASVTYYHVELPLHDVVLAEDLPVESYLDTGDRDNFASASSVVVLHPDFSGRAELTARVWDAMGCAPLVLAGPELAAARARLSAISERDTPHHNAHKIIHPMAVA